MVQAPTMLGSRSARVRALFLGSATLAATLWPSAALAQAQPAGGEPPPAARPVAPTAAPVAAPAAAPAPAPAAAPPTGSAPPVDSALLPPPATAAAPAPP